MKTFGKILLTLILLGGLGYGGWWAYTRYFADAPKEGTVYVQSVSAITGVGPAGQRSRYSGVVEAKNVIEINPDKDLTVKECYVSAGDPVKRGTKLFAYDVDSMQISFEQLKLDIQGLENSIQTSREKVESWKNKLARARENKKYEIQMDIQTEELEIRKKEYELTGKRKQYKELEMALRRTVVYCTVTGTVRSVKRADGGGQEYGEGGQDTAYITIVAGNDYCVKGTVSEQTIHTLQEGMPVRILSRVDDAVWTGHIYRINTEETKQNTNRYYYYDEGSGDRASKYDFFVALDSNEGLLMGQHVYIEPGAQAAETVGALLLPAYYVAEDAEGPFVYAADGQDRIEKRPVVLGDRDEENGTVAILEGLTYLDRIAFPDETVQVGLTASETAYVPEDMGLMDPAMEGADWAFEAGMAEDGLDGFEGDVPGFFPEDGAMAADDFEDGAGDPKAEGFEDAAEDTEAPVPADDRPALPHPRRPAAAPQPGGFRG